MGAIATLIMYAIIIGVVSVVAYFVIKKAVKDALREYKNLTRLSNQRLQSGTREHCCLRNNNEKR